MKKKNTRFKVKYRGYDVKEVEAYIAEMQAKSETAMAQQRERIEALKTQNESLKAELAVLKSREEQIKVTLLKATNTANELDEQIKRRYKAELDRLKLFRAKWTGAYDELKERYHFSKDALNMESVAVQTELELTKYLTQEFSLAKGDDIDDMEAYFKSEVQRLTHLQQQVQLDVEKKQKSKRDERASAQVSADEFCLEEALNPTESLEELCKSMGVNG